MTPRMLARLEWLAREAETPLREAVRRHHATLALAVQQRGVLAAYRDRLGAGWRGGGVVPAGQARRAGLFADASHGAEARIGAAEAQARAQLAEAMAGLAVQQARCRALAEARRQAALRAERAAEAMLERDIQWRPGSARSTAAGA
jgi:hypothetical protein